MSERDVEKLTEGRRSFEEIAAVCDASAEQGAPMLKAAGLWLMENYPGQLQPCLVILKGGTRLHIEVFLSSDIEFKGRRLAYGFRGSFLYQSTAYYYVLEEGMPDDDPSYTEGVHCQENDFLDHFKKTAQKASGLISPKKEN